MDAAFRQLKAGDLWAFLFFEILLQGFPVLVPFLPGIGAVGAVVEYQKDSRYEDIGYDSDHKDCGSGHVHHLPCFLLLFIFTIIAKLNKNFT